MSQQERCRKVQKAVFKQPELSQHIPYSCHTTWHFVCSRLFVIFKKCPFSIIGIWPLQTFNLSHEIIATRNKSAIIVATQVLINCLNLEQVSNTRLFLHSELVHYASNHYRQFQTILFIATAYYLAIGKKTFQLCDKCFVQNSTHTSQAEFSFKGYLLCKLLRIILFMLITVVSV